MAIDILHPEELFDRAGLKEGMTVADLGVGREATFTLPAAKLVGERGTVYAVDVVKHELEVVHEKAEHRNLHNVHTVWSDIEIVGAARQVLDHTVDVALLVDTLFQAHHYEQILLEARRMLKMGGRLVIVDFKEEKTAIGPEAEHKVTAAEIKELLPKTGFELVEDFVPGDHHWGMVLKRTA